MRLNWIIVLLLAWALGWSAEYDSLRTEQRNDQWVVIHQVDLGETLYAISRRYKADLLKIVELNNIKSNNIRSGQILEIPIKVTEPINVISQDKSTKETRIHVVSEGETLFAIGRKYGVKASEITSLNNLTSESLSIGQELSIGKSSEIPKEIKKPLLPFTRALMHYVQSGENLQQIAQKRNVSIDSLQRWNNLRNNNINIGQILWYRTYAGIGESVVSSEVYGKHITEGIAMQIEDMENTDKYLALHKELPTGTLLEIRNLMNNKKVYVRVVGQLPSTGVNKDILIRLTPISFKRLGILDARARVELTYYDE
ncbi:MAG: LysM peptidoglycan-binding domain-containing protein [Cytophagales bacterium]|nr:LysM peptidoglycan-binding domain-containing protein [Cytophagales bacterium]